MDTKDDFSECIEAYKNLITTYNTSLLKSYHVMWLMLVRNTQKKQQIVQ